MASMAASSRRGAPSAQYTQASRPTASSAVDKQFVPHPSFDQDNEPCWFDPQYLGDMARALATGARRRGDILAWLRQRQPDWDLMLSVMSETHSIEHHCFHGIDPNHAFHATMKTTDLARRLAVDVFHAVDDSIGSFVSGLPDDTMVVVFSLHGMRPNAATSPPGCSPRCCTGSPSASV